MQVSFFFTIPVLLALAIIPAYATTTQHSYYDITDNGDGTFSNTIYSNGEAVRIFRNGAWVDYNVIEDASKIQVETVRGSVSYNKNTCALDFYNATSTAIQSKLAVANDKYLALISVNGSGVWTGVNQVNNAACTTSVIQQDKYVEIQSLKHVAGVGDFKVRYIKNFNQDWKTTLEPTNLSGLTNRQFGVMQNMTVPKLIQVGNETKDLSQFNGVVLNRAWLDSHKAMLLNFKNGINFDFSFGYKNLNSITIYYTGGNSATLSFLYNRDTPIILPGQTLVIDPTFGYTGATNVYTATTGVAATVACPAASSTTSGDGQTLRKYDSADPTGYCRVEAAQWNISTIPDGSLIQTATFKVTITATVSDINCNISGVSTDITSAPAQTLYDDIVNSGTDTDKRYYLSNNSFCTTAGTKTISLGTNGTTDIHNDLSSDRFALGIAFYSMKRDGGVHNLISNTKQLQVNYTKSPPNSINTLHSTGVTTTTTDLVWTAPSLNGETLQRYVFNYTTPCGTPNTFLANGTTATSYTVSGLVPTTCYSFRVSAATAGGYNITNANIVNVTTLTFNQANFTVGDLSFNANNENVIPIYFTRTDLSSTSLYLNVTYPDTWELACDFHYKFAMTNHTYTNLNATAVSSTESRSSFLFTNVDREIINVYCWDQNGTGSGKYLITQTVFPLLTYIQKFDSGHYGTAGNFGAIDLVYFAVIIVSMVGLNRTNESVGAGFMIVITAAMAYFHFITFETAAISGISLAVLLIIITTRKD